MRGEAGGGGGGGSLEAGARGHGRKKGCCVCSGGWWSRRVETDWAPMGDTSRQYLNISIGHRDKKNAHRNESVRFLSEAKDVEGRSYWGLVVGLSIKRGGSREGWGERGGIVRVKGFGRGG